MKRKTIRIITFIFFSLVLIPSAVCADESPVVTYGISDERNYLVAYSDSENIFGKIVHDTGATIKPEFSISLAQDIQSNPAAAYDTLLKRYLVVWKDNRNSAIAADIYGQFINASNGALLGSNFALSTDIGDQSNPSIAFNPGTNQYLLSWEDNNGADIDISGVLIDTGGNILRSLTISGSAEDQVNPAIAVDPVNKRYLVVWEDNINKVDREISWILLDKDGNVIQPRTTITTAGDQGSPAVAYDSANRRYLAVWEDRLSASDFDLMGVLIDKDGVQTGPKVLTIYAAGTKQAGPSIVFDSNAHRYLIVWQDGAANPGILGKFINNDGTPDPGNITFSNSSDAGMGLSAAFNTYCKNFLVGFIDAGLALKKEGECSLSSSGSLPDGGGGSYGGGSGDGSSSSAGGGGCFIDTAGYGFVFHER